MHACMRNRNAGIYHARRERKILQKTVARLQNALLVHGLETWKIVCKESITFKRNAKRCILLLTGLYPDFWLLYSE